MIRLNSLTIRCLQCGCYFEHDCSDFESDDDCDERQMGTQIGYHWECELQCPDCDAEGTINVDAWEYPLGIIDYHEGRSSGELEVAEYDIDLLQESDDESVDNPEKKQGCLPHSVTRPGIPTTTYLLYNTHPGVGNSTASVQSSVGGVIPDMGSFLNQSLQRIYDDFTSAINLKSPLENQKCLLYFTFVKGDPDEIKYSKKEHQQLYLLRYFYAYLIEYWYLYSKISLKSYSIFSIGCGCFIDLYGFLCIKDCKTAYEYYGIDCEDWPYKDLLSNPYMHGKFEKKSLSTCLVDFQKQGLDETLGKINVFVFPKTIEYMEDDDKGIHDISALAQCIEKTFFASSKIYLILNGMDSNFKDDEDRLDILRKSFMAIGYNSIETKYESSVFPQYFYQFFSGGLFIDGLLRTNIKNFCTCCSNHVGCIVNKKPKTSPIFETKYFHCKIIELVKYDSQCK